jgi:sugar/nucleoside kinase (ribokinase family)
MLSDRGANAALSPDDVTLEPVTGGGHLHLSGYMLLDNASRPAGLAALRRAMAMGWTTSVDPQAASHLAAAGAGNFLSWVSGVDLCCPTIPNWKPWAARLPPCTRHAPWWSPTGGRARRG